MNTINIAALKDMITSYEITPIEVSDYKIHNKVYLAVDNPKNFIDIAASWNEKLIYLSADNYILEVFLLPNDWYDEYPEDFIREVRKYNKKSILLILINLGRLPFLYCRME